jgi:hypothetical protein
MATQIGQRRHWGPPIVDLTLRTEFRSPVLNGQLPSLQLEPRAPTQLPVEVRDALAEAVRHMANLLDFPTDDATEWLEKLDSLMDLSENWDDEGAQAPSRSACERARLVLDWARRQSLTIADVDSDVLGGVAVWLSGPVDRRVWISCMNDGRDSVVVLEGDTGRHTTWSAEGQREILAFFSGNYESAN